MPPECYALPIWCRSTGKKYNFETKDWKKTSFTEEKVPDLIDQLERQKAALPDAVHVFFFNKAEKEIPSGVRQQIEDAGFAFIARPSLETTAPSVRLKV